MPNDTPPADNRHYQRPAGPISAATVRARMGRIAISLAVTVVFVAIAVWLLDMRSVLAGLARFDTSLLPLALAFGAAVIVLRWLRLAAALHQRPNRDLLRAAALHGAAVAVLPAKLGELILPLALNRMTGMSLAAAAGLLFVIRIYDLMTLAIVGAGALALAAEPLGLEPLRLPAAAAALAALAVMVTLPLLARAAVTVLGRPLRRWARVHDLFHRLAAGMTTLRPRQIAAVIVASLSTWCAIFATFHVAAIATGADVAAATTALAGTAASLAFALPVNGVASVGPFEAAWMAVMARAGIGIEIAAAGALAAHAVMIVVNLAAGGLALVLGSRARSG